MRNGRVWSAFGRRVGPTRRGPDDRGAVLIEALIVIPLLMMMTLGIIEYGGAYREDATVASASRAGARVASALSKTDFGVVPALTDSGVVTATAVASVLQSLGSTGPQAVWIYRVEPLNAACGPPLFTGCVYKVGYGWDPANKRFLMSPLAGSAPWPASKQIACPTGPLGPPDQIAVWVKANHVAVTHMFGSGRTLTGQTVMRLEPDVGSNCGTS